MTWTDILNHDHVLERFRRSIERNRLASTYLFVGPDGIGKRMFALKLAQALLCESNPPATLDPCGNCSGCRQVAAQTHPDLILVSKPHDKAFIPVELFIGTKEHRRQEGLVHDIGLKPFRGKSRIAIIDDADYLNAEGANSLLKTLEEPPPHSLLILLGTSEQRQLSTIVSRSQVVRFHPLTSPQVLSILKRLESPEWDTPDLTQVAHASSGSVAMALRLCDTELGEFRQQLFRQLATGDPGTNNFAKSITGFVDSVGKDGAKKRARLSLIGDFAISFYRQWLVQLTGAVSDPDRIDPSLTESVTSAVAPWHQNINHGCDIAGQCIERCTEMQRHIRSNAGAATNVDAWLRDLGRISRGELTTPA